MRIVYFSPSFSHHLLDFAIFFFGKKKLLLQSFTEWITSKYWIIDKLIDLVLNIVIFISSSCRHRRENLVMFLGLIVSIEHNEDSSRKFQEEKHWNILEIKFFWFIGSSLPTHLSSDPTKKWQQQHGWADYGNRWSTQRGKQWEAEWKRIHGSALLTWVLPPDVPQNWEWDKHPNEFQGTWD